MNVYQITIQPKAVPGMGYSSGPSCSQRSISIVTTSLQEAMSLARGKLAANEEIAGIYLQAEDVVVDYSTVINGQC